MTPNIYVHMSILRHGVIKQHKGQAHTFLFTDFPQGPAVCHSDECPHGISCVEAVVSRDREVTHRAEGHRSS